jgi:hypothetical protein
VLAGMRAQKYTHFRIHSLLSVAWVMALCIFVTSYHRFVETYSLHPRGTNPVNCTLNVEAASFVRTSYPVLCLYDPFLSCLNVYLLVELEFSRALFAPMIVVKCGLGGMQSADRSLFLERNLHLA